MKPLWTPRSSTFGNTLSNAADADARVAVVVDAEDVRLSATEVHVFLGDGRLASTDLVFSRGGWISLVDHEDFYDAASARARIETRRRWLYYLALVFMAFVATVLKIVLRTW